MVPSRIIKEGVITFIDSFGFQALMDVSPTLGTKVVVEMLRHLGVNTLYLAEKSDSVGAAIRCNLEEVVEDVAPRPALAAGSYGVIKPRGSLQGFRREMEDLTNLCVIINHWAGGDATLDHESARNAIVFAAVRIGLKRKDESAALGFVASATNLRENLTKVLASSSNKELVAFMVKVATSVTRFGGFKVAIDTSSLVEGCSKFLEDEQPPSPSLLAIK